jgi:hypothetical protein
VTVPGTNKTVAPTPAPVKNNTGTPYIIAGCLGGVAFTVAAIFVGLKFAKPAEEESSAVSNVENGRKY